MSTAIQANQLENFYGMIQAVQTISESNITLSGVQNIGGATGAIGKRVVVTGQTTTTEDGVYIMQTGAWLRAPEADDDGGFVADLGQMLFVIEEGTYAGQTWKFDQARGAGVVGTDALSAAVYISPATAVNRVFGEELTYTDNTFTADTANNATAGTLRVYRNGARQNEGGGNDYTYSAPTITFTRRLTPNTVILVDYEYS